jgi:hypothetical protein
LANAPTSVLQNAGRLDGLPGFGEFNLLDAFGSDQEGNRLAMQ